MGGSVLVRGGRIVGWGDHPTRPADVRVRDGLVIDVGPGLARDGEQVVDATGGWVIPGLWDAHVHVGQWVRSTTWLDVAGAAGPDDVVATVAEEVARWPGERRPLIAFGYRSVTWPRPATVAELDAVSGGRPVIAISGDVHNGWLSSAALSLLGLPPREGVLTENDWFSVVGRLGSLPGCEPTPAEEDAAFARLSARGLVGLVDLEWEPTYRAWPERVARGQRSLRVRAGFYPPMLDDVLTTGLRTGDPLPGGEGLVTLGPLKVIADGSLGTRTAWCCEPYAGVPPTDPSAFGAPNLPAGELTGLLRAAHEAGLEAAVHAIGDRANGVALDAFAASGARGSIEHAQLLTWADVPRFAALGVRASVQPHHLVADRDLAEEVWPGRTGRLYAVRSLIAAGATVVLGSDAPVSPPDPWLAMAAAVHRTGDDRPAWHAEQAITPAQSLAASVDGRRLAVGEPGDLVVLDADPLDPATLADMPVRATVCAGRLTHGGR